MGEKRYQNKKELGAPGQRCREKKVAEDQENHAHGEGMKMGFFEQRVEIFGKEHLTAHLAA